MSISYLQRSSKLWYYIRLRIPADVRKHFPSAEFHRSLKTKDFAEARRRVRLWLHKLESVFSEIRRGALTTTEIATLVRAFYAETLDSNLVTHVAKMENIVRVNNHEAADLCERFIKLDTKALKEDALDSIKPRVERFLGRNIAQLEKDSPLYLHICRLFLAARIKAFEVLRDRSNGEYDNLHDQLNALLFQTDDAPVRPMASVAGPAEDGEKIAEVLDLYKRDHLSSGKWTDKTLHEMEDSLGLFLEISGNRNIREYAFEDFLTWKERLTLLPKNRSKSPKYRGKTTTELLGMTIPVKDRLGITTVNKHLGRISSFFGWATKRRYVTVNYADGLCLSKSQREHEERECYDQGDLERLIMELPRDPQYPERYWVPLIALHQGMRLDEVCQLYVSDIVNVDGKPCFNISDEKPGQKLKNKASKRVIPLHPKLVSLGLLRYVEMLKSRQVERLWPRLKRGKNGYSSALANWYQTFNRAKITQNPKRVFHSSRHCVANKMPKVKHVVIQAILGHAPEGGTTGMRYIKPPSVSTMLDALRSVNYGLDIEPFEIAGISMGAGARRKICMRTQRKPAGEEIATAA